MKTLTQSPEFYDSAVDSTLAPQKAVCETLTPHCGFNIYHSLSDSIELPGVPRRSSKLKPPQVRHCVAPSSMWRASQLRVYVAFRLSASRVVSRVTHPIIQQQSQQAYKQLTSAFYTINSKYRISWECAELLIELGGGGSSSSPPRTSTSAPAMQQSVGRSEGLKSKREQAIALQDAAKVPPSPGPLTTTPSLPCPPLARPPNYLACRASTKRNDSDVTLLRPDSMVLRSERRREGEL
ncbi:hypothetical protein B0H14DRAFT_3683541 [Mycena olivaceomarginata]|nr:hypothetical protein B0H14DRAFT_3683541 [Mycena olivaceomarginata]